MAEIEFTIPTVQYGNAKIRMTPQELYELSEGGVSLYDVGMKAMEFLSLVTQGFEAGKQIDFTPQSVTGQYQESPEKEALRETGRLSGLEPHPITEATPEEVEEIIKTLGATTVEPWTKTPAPSTTPKAWDIDV
jgi:hypothetical protein